MGMADAVATSIPGGSCHADMKCAVHSSANAPPWLTAHTCGMQCGVCLSSERHAHCRPRHKTGQHAAALRVEHLAVVTDPLSLHSEDDDSSLASHPLALMAPTHHVAHFESLSLWPHL